MTERHAILGLHLLLALSPMLSACGECDLTSLGARYAEIYVLSEESCLRGIEVWPRTNHCGESPPGGGYWRALVAFDDLAPMPVNAPVATGDAPDDVAALLLSEHSRSQFVGIAHGTLQGCVLDEHRYKLVLIERASGSRDTVYLCRSNVPDELATSLDVIERLVADVDTRVASFCGQQ